MFSTWYDLSNFKKFATAYYSYIQQHVIKPLKFQKIEMRMNINWGLLQCFKSFHRKATSAHAHELVSLRATRTVFDIVPKNKHLTK